ncbi:MAG: hypothetical protein PVI81_09570, partial [Anaerolineales bacterium]
MEKTPTRAFSVFPARLMGQAGLQGMQRDLLKRILLISSLSQEAADARAQGCSAGQRKTQEVS